MIYILGLYLKTKFNVLYSICRLFGVGKHIAQLIFNDLNISFHCRVKNLTQNTVIKILKWIDLNKILVKNSLKQKMLSKNRLNFSSKIKNNAFNTTNYQ